MTDYYDEHAPDLVLSDSALDDIDRIASRGQVNHCALHNFTATERAPNRKCRKCAAARRPIATETVREFDGMGRIIGKAIACQVCGTFNPAGRYDCWSCHWELAKPSRPKAAARTKVGQQFWQFFQEVSNAWLEGCSCRACNIVDRNERGDLSDFAAGQLLRLCYESLSNWHDSEAYSWDALPAYVSRPGHVVRESLANVMSDQIERPS